MCRLIRHSVPVSPSCMLACTKRALRSDWQRSHEDLSDRLWLAHQYAQMRHTTLSTTIYSQHFRVISFHLLTKGARLIVHQWERKNIPINLSKHVGAPYSFVTPYVSKQSILSAGNTRPPLKTTVLIEGQTASGMDCYEHNRSRIIKINVATPIGREDQKIL